MKKKKTKPRKDAKRVNSRQKPESSEKKLEKALDAVDAHYREKHQKYASFVETIQHLPFLEKAESWLSYVSLNIEDFGEQEALVYLASRKIDCSKQVASLNAHWKEDERRTIEAWNRPATIIDVDTGKQRKLRRKSVIDVSQIENTSPYLLPDFWCPTRLLEQTIDATMLRTVRWYGMGGFEQWWKRLARETATLFSEGGMVRPPLAFWIFSMCRSDYAISLLRSALGRALDNLELLDYGQTAPWTFEFESASSAVHIPSAASIVFSNLILQPDKPNDEVVSGAMSALQKHQAEDGSWPCWAVLGEEPSIGATAMAIHAIALAKPTGYERMLSLGKEYLLGQQSREGLWDDKGAADTVYLTVLVLDAIELANNGTSLTFSLPSSSAKRSTDSHHDRRFMEMAIQEAQQSIAEDQRVHPRVGAVIVKDSEVVSKAHRGEQPKCHAEYIALEGKLPDDLVAGATVYTTLEPCTTRTHPKIPCAQRLIERRVGRVFIGMLDPNPEIRGLGEQALNEAGIETQFFPRDLRSQIEELNRDFIRAQKERQPRANAAPPKAVPEPEGNPKVAEISKHNGKTVTVFNRQKFGHGYLEGFWPNGAVVVDCTPLWVVLQDPVAKNQQSFPLENVEVLFDFDKNRLQLTLYR